MVGLTHVAHRAIGEFSKGMTRRSGIAQALINDPEFLILDEPTSGLDPIGTKQVKDLLLNLKARNKTILLSSHLLSDVQDVCDRMVMLYGGKIRAEGTVEELLEDTNATVIRAPRLKPSTIDRIERVLQEEEGVGIEQVSQPRQRLEDLFLDIVEAARREHVETSGVTETGRTADFLRHQEGDSLIDSLVSETEIEPEARAVERTQKQSDVQAKGDMLDKLVEAAPEPEHRATEVDDAPQAPKNVDESMIEGLLGGEEKSDAGESS
jgi:ABC-2 type transport system ATP-binding protein